MNLINFNFKNYTYDPKSVDVIYTKKDDPEDSWIHIIKEGNDKGIIIIQVEKCSTVNAFFISNEEIPNTPSIIEEKLCQTKY